MVGIIVYQADLLHLSTALASQNKHVSSQAGVAFDAVTLRRTSKECA